MLNQPAAPVDSAQAATETIANAQREMADECRALSCYLHELSLAFGTYGGKHFENHAPFISGMASHLSIYAHQIEARLEKPETATTTPTP